MYAQTEKQIRKSPRKYHFLELDADMSALFTRHRLSKDSVTFGLLLGPSEEPWQGKLFMLI